MVRGYETKNIPVLRTGGVSLFRPARRLRQNKQLRRKFQQIIYIERHKMAPNNRKVTKAFRRAMLLIPRRQEFLHKLYKKFTAEARALNTPQAAPKLTSAALKLLQTKLVARKGSTDPMLLPGTFSRLQAPRSQSRMLQPNASGIGVRNDYLKMRALTLRVKQNKSTFDKKLNALRYQRSVRRMSKLGHQLSGFTYRYPLRARRRTVPRLDARVLPRK